MTSKLLSANADLQTLHTLSLDDAKDQALNILSTIKHTKPELIVRLKNDISKAPTSKEVSCIMWNTALAGENMRVVGSKWS